MKKIKTFQDLAINGATAAFEEPLHVGRPNIGNREVFLQYAEEMFDRRRLTNDGPLVKEFEQKVADYHNVKHCVAMCNGTVALEIAIRALELKGEVIIPSYTFVATAHSLNWQEITPVFADINPDTHTLDPEAVRKMITPKTTGIIAVHLWGRGAAQEELQAIADEYDLKLMFDAAHAFGCSHDGKMIGSFGECEVLSFHATKVFNTFEGGAVLTNNDALAEKMKLMRNFGFAGPDNVIHPGTNGKMIEVCAAMGLTNIESLDELIEANRKNYNAYKESISKIPNLNIISFDENESNNFQYVVLEIGEDFPASRDEIITTLYAENIWARKYFWPGCHAMSPYRELYPHASMMLPNTVKVSERVIVLPTGPTLPEGTTDLISDILKVYIDKKYINSME